MPSGYNDYQRYSQWFGAPLAQGSAVPIAIGSTDLGTFSVPNWSSILVAVLPTGGDVTVDVSEYLLGAPATLTVSNAQPAPAGKVFMQNYVLVGAQVDVAITNLHAGVTADYAVVPSNSIQGATVQGGGSNVFNGITGWVKSDGTIRAGTGFTVTYTDTGKYAVTISPALSATPVVVGSATGAGSNSVIFDVHSDPTAAGFTVYTYGAGAGTDVDCDFQFIAVPIQ